MNAKKSLLISVLFVALVFGDHAAIGLEGKDLTLPDGSATEPSYYEHFEELQKERKALQEKDKKGTATKDDYVRMQAIESAQDVCGIINANSVIRINAPNGLISQIQPSAPSCPLKYYASLLGGYFSGEKTLEELLGKNDLLEMSCGEDCQARLAANKEKLEEKINELQQRR